MAKKPAPSDLMDKFMLRMPDGMRDRIAKAAKENGRSMNAEIVRRLERTFEIDELTADPGVELVLRPRYEEIDPAELLQDLMHQLDYMRERLEQLRLEDDRPSSNRTGPK